jgi:hypothetical protein
MERWKRSLRRSESGAANWRSSRLKRRSRSSSSFKKRPPQSARILAASSGLFKTKIVLGGKFPLAQPFVERVAWIPLGWLDPLSKRFSAARYQPKIRKLWMLNGDTPQSPGLIIILYFERKIITNPMIRLDTIKKASRIIHLHPEKTLSHQTDLTRHIG